MLKGGYQIIDLKGIELSDVGYYMVGIYAKVLDNHDKTILISNININGTIRDYYVQPIYDEYYNLIMTVGEHTLVVSEDDTISILDGIVGGSGGGGGTTNYNNLSNKPSINSHTLAGNQSSNDLGLQEKLTPGNGISIENGIISATGGGGTTNYNNLENKPSINEHTLAGDQTASDLGLQEKLTPGNGISIENGIISATGGGTSYLEGVGIDISAGVISASFMDINLFIDDTSQIWSDIKAMAVGDTVHASAASVATCNFDPTLISSLNEHYPFIVNLNSGSTLQYDDIGSVLTPLLPTNSGSMVFANQIPIFGTIRGSGGWSGIVLISLAIEYDATNMSWGVMDLTIKRIL